MLPNATLEAGREAGELIKSVYHRVASLKFPIRYCSMVLLQEMWRSRTAALQQSRTGGQRVINYLQPQAAASELVIAGDWHFCLEGWAVASSSTVTGPSLINSTWKKFYCNATQNHIYRTSLGTYTYLKVLSSEIRGGENIFKWSVLTSWLRFFNFKGTTSKREEKSRLQRLDNNWIELAGWVHENPANDDLQWTKKSLLHWLTIRQYRKATIPYIISCCKCLIISRYNQTLNHTTVQAPHYTYYHTLRLKARSSYLLACS